MKSPLAGFLEIWLVARLLWLVIVARHGSRLHVSLSSFSKGKTTLLKHIANRALSIPPNIDVLLCEQGEWPVRNPFSYHVGAAHWPSFPCCCVRGGSRRHTGRAVGAEGRHPPPEAPGGGEAAAGSTGEGRGQCSWEAGEGKGQFTRLYFPWESVFIDLIRLFHRHVTHAQH